ncbi:antibiotic biosynthesis monooxygenase family protein [uncultured Bacteroides sp.]|uniref:antibiotic biosynthesis monooxygenase family protein n=1 Tax=uncultured Bacteroides sp. TaxID=162156 RepID=UPI0025FAEFDE|nr:antibiotic biosynthesis monooxygenase family protein [uncultured Bacteroides sp.]
MENIIVLFEVTLKAGKMENYLKTAAALKEELSKAEGFICAERFSSLAVENKILSKSEWKDEESVAKWRNLLEHRMAQKQGRMTDFINYKITVVNPIRCYTMGSREKAPLDSNLYFDV